MERRGFLGALFALPFMKLALPKAAGPIPIPIAEDGKPLFYNCNSGNLYQYTDTSNGDLVGANTWVKVDWDTQSWKWESKG